MKYFLLLLIITNCFISYVSSKQPNYEILSKMIDKIPKDKYNHILRFINKIEKMRKADVNDDFKCTMCTNVVNAFTTTVKEKLDLEPYIKVSELICSIFKDPKDCKHVVEDYGKTFFYGLLERIGRGKNFCTKIGFCNEYDDEEDMYDYANEVVKDKVYKEKEKIKGENRIKILQINDMHYDEKYKENANIFCFDHLCCRDEVTKYARKKSGKYGADGPCDTGTELLESFFEKAKELKPDFIVWLGDNSPHDRNLTQDEVYEISRKLSEKMKTNFPDTPVIPVIGNHEYIPTDIQTENWKEVNAKFGEIYSQFFNLEIEEEEIALDFFSEYGYYTKKIKPDSNLRLVVLNCIFCDDRNFFTLGGDHRPARKMFEWLKQVLHMAEKSNEFVYIFDHIGINSEFYLSECAYRMRAILDRYEYTVRGYFSGHSHTDDVAAVKEYFEPRRVTHINFVAPALTTHNGRFPSFRMYYVDEDTKNIYDFDQYRFELDKANVNGTAYWKIAYNAREFYQVKDLTYIEKIASVDVAKSKYVLNRYAEGEYARKNVDNPEEIKKAECLIGQDSFEDYYQCFEHKMFSKDFINKIINDISGEWPFIEDE